MTKPAMVLAVLPLALMNAACINEVFGVEGSGNVITETRDVSGFDAVVLSGSGQVVIEVTGVESLTIEAEDNILPELETVVRDGRLELGTKTSISPTRVIVYTVTVADLAAIELSGSGAITASGVASTDFGTDISGSGSVHVEGASDRLTLSISGSGVFDGEDLISAQGSVDVSGSGRAVVNVTDELQISLSGSGAVEYIGSPTVQSDESGSGTVTRRD